MEVTDSENRCGLMRRLAAIAYDSLLLSAVLFAATAVLLPFTHGEAIHSGNYVYLLYLLGWSYLYFGWQWTHGGQTLGMRAWKIKLVMVGNDAVTWPVATRRFLLAMLSWLPAGAGLLWSLIDKETLAFHDRYSNSRLIKLSGLS
jgi:uncharacterized RDD family membrane protein YckC